MINFFHKKSGSGVILCEDSKTSMIFESLSCLPDNLFWEILKRSSSIREIEPGHLISIDFWPHWDATGTSNERFVEPDVFIRFENIDIIVEAKIKINNPQYEEQWLKEIISYHNEFGSFKDLILIAVDGLSTFISEELAEIQIYKTSWSRLSQEITYLKDRIPHHMLVLITQAFNLFGVKPYSSVDDLLKQNYQLNKDSRQFLENILRF